MSYAIYNYSYQNDSQNDMKPQNTHLIWEISEDKWYFVNSADNKQLWKTVDKGVTYTQVDVDPTDIYGGDDKSRPKKIFMGWYERSINKIYFIDSDKDDTTIYV